MIVMIVPMRRAVWSIVAGVMLVVCAVAAPQAQLPTPPPSRITLAEAAVDAMVAREFARVSAQFDTAMKKAMPDDSLQKGWDGAMLQIGGFVRRNPAREQHKSGYAAVIIPCDFQRGKMEVTIVFDAAGQIAGMQMRPATPPVQYAPPAYAVANAYTEREVTVGTGEWALPGTFSRPVGTGPFPAIVLVHGSGPNDRDETFGPNKTFKDQSLGLASRGVAVLRYDKRTLVHRAKVAPLTQFTVKEETIDDAVAAVAMLRSEASVDPSRIFVLGHSLGGMIAPRIAAADARIAGIIIMAGAVRSLDQSVLDQYTYLAEADGTVTAAEQQMIDDAKRTIEIVAKLTPEDAKTGRSIGGGPVSYWLDLRGFDPPAAAARLSHRVLVLQGQRDYQVTVADFERWKAGLANKTNAQFRLYPTLNHFFLPGTGKSLPAEYSTPGNVPVEVITDIAAWVKGS